MITLIIINLLTYLILIFIRHRNTIFDRIINKNIKWFMFHFWAIMPVFNTICLFILFIACYKDFLIWTKRMYKIIFDIRKYRVDNSLIEQLDPFKEEDWNER